MLCVATGQSAAAASQEQPLRAETAVTAALDQNGTASGSKKKHKKHKQQTGQLQAA